MECRWRVEQSFSSPSLLGSRRTKSHAFADEKSVVQEVPMRQADTELCASVKLF